MLEPERQPEQGRLAAAVGPRDREELAGPHLEINLAQHGRAVRVGELDGFELER